MKVLKSLLSVSLLVLTLNLALAATTEEIDGRETIDPQGLTFEIGYDWRGTWGNQKKIELIWIKMKKDGNYVNNMKMKFFVSAFEYGAGFQLKAAQEKVKELEKTVQEALNANEKLWVQRDLRYRYWDDLELLSNAGKVTPWPSTPIFSYDDIYGPTIDREDDREINQRPRRHSWLLTAIRSRLKGTKESPSSVE